MDTELQDLRRALAGRSRGRLASALRKRALAYVRRRRRSGGTIRAIGTDLGLSYETVRRWTSEAVTDGVKPVPVDIVERELARPAGRIVSLVSPNGFRVDGLSLDEAATLLRALR